MKKINWARLVLSLLITQAAGGIGAIATTPKIATWYAGLNKPFFNPPGWIFGPVWTILFLMMGMGLYLFWMSKEKNKSAGFRWFGIQLGLNILWSYIFFGAERPLLALIEILFLWGAIWMTIKNLSDSGKWLYPYLAWVSFATLLNAAIWWLNK